MEIQIFVENEWSNKWFEVVRKIPNISWLGLSNNKNLTNEIIVQYGEFYPWNMKTVNAILETKQPIDTTKLDDSIYCDKISCYSYFTFDIVEKYIHCDWNWGDLSKHPNLTFDFVKKHKNQQWNWELLSCHKNITLKTIVEHCDCPWDWTFVTKNPNVFMEMIIEHPDYPWNLEHVARNLNVTIDALKKINVSSLSIGDVVSLNSKITLEIINAHPCLFFTWTVYELSKNPTLTLDIVATKNNWNWNMALVSANRNLPLDFFNKYPHFNWSWYEISCNEFVNEKQHYVLHQTQIILFLHIHDYHVTNTHHVVERVEQILFDCYLVKTIIQY